MKKKYNQFGMELEPAMGREDKMKVFVLLRDENDMPLEYSLGGVYSSFKKAEDAAKGRDGDWFIEEVVLDRDPITPIESAIEYLEEFGYKVEKGRR